MPMTAAGTIGGAGGGRGTDGGGRGTDGTFPCDLMGIQSGMLPAGSASESEMKQAGHRRADVHLRRSGDAGGG